MALTLENIYDRNQTLNILTKIEFKRRYSDGTYETSWNSIEQLVAYPIMTSDVITSLKSSIPSDSYSFGYVKVPDCKLKLYSKNGEFANENNANSIFFNFVRHRSQVKISQGYRDGKSGTEIYQEVYRGFINEKSTNTKVDADNLHELIQVEDMLIYLLKEYTYSQFTLTSLTLENFVYELMNRSEFTDFLTVSSSNIDAGYDIQHIYQSYTEDSETKYAWEGQTQWLTVLQELSTGHSIFYQREGTFYYKSIQATGSTIKTFDKTKIISFENATTGIDQVYETLYWGDSGISWESPVNNYNRSKTFEVNAVRDLTDINGMLGNIGTRTASARERYTLKIPLYPDLFILDKIQVDAGRYFPQGAFILDVSVLDVDILRDPEGAAGVDDTSYWMIREIDSNYSNCITKLTVERTTDV